jgi:hypothetical protein
MPESHPTADELVARAATKEAHSIERKLLVAAAFSETALDTGILVGGVAADLHTGSYRPTDIDLVGYRQAGHAQRLADLGFKKSGRYWLIDFDDGETLAVEVPDDQLFELAAHPPVLIDLEPGELAVISIDDLMMDRLLAATGDEPVTFDEAVRLGVAAYASIGWQDLEDRAVVASEGATGAGEALPGVLKRVRRAAIRTLRNGSNNPPQ